MSSIRKPAAKAKPTRADRRMVRNRKALLGAAETLIAAKGFEGVTIDEIAEAADLAKGTFYNYFDDKNEIAAELALMIRQEIETAVALAQTGIDDPARRLTLGMTVFLHTAVTRPEPRRRHGADVRAMASSRGHRQRDAANGLGRRLSPRTLFHRRFACCSRDDDRRRASGNITCAATARFGCGAKARFGIVRIGTEIAWN